MKFSSPIVQSYLKELSIGRLATSTIDGVPHVVAVSYVHDETNMYFSTLTNTKKVRNIRKNRNVAFIVDDTGGPAGWRYVVVEGEAEEITDNTLFGEVRKMLYVKYPVLDSDEWAIREESHSLISINPSKVITANLT